jgi:hypothetical protein
LEARNACRTIQPLLRRMELIRGFFVEADCGVEVA